MLLYKSFTLRIKFRHFLFGLLYVFSSFSLYSQDPKIADSLKKVYNNQKLDYLEKLEILQEISSNSIESSDKRKYSDELIEAAKKKACTAHIFNGLLQNGPSYLDPGDYSKALENYFMAMDYSTSKTSEGILKVTIGDVYSYTDNHSRAVKYYNEAINFFRESKNTRYLAIALLNAGDEYMSAGKIDQAYAYFEESEKIFRDQGELLPQGMAKGNLGMLDAQRGKTDSAEVKLQEAIQILEKFDQFSSICTFLNTMADINIDKDEDSIALDYATMSLDLAETYRFKDQISEANLRLARIYEKQNNIPESYFHYKDYINYRDSVNNVSTAQQIAGLRADYEVSQKQAEIDLLSEQRKNQQTLVISIAVVLFLIALLAIGLYRRNRFIKKTSNIIENERNRAEGLLLNILPKRTAEELKQNGRVKAKKFASVTVLFADFKRFTLVAEKLPPERLIKTIDYYFSQFDKITDKYGIEKIKTIGDSYMAVSGLPHPSHDHANRMLMAAFEMIEFVKETKEKSLFDDADFEVRIGLNSGPVVAGVVGIKKFAYDIWGDTVNIAARMESHSEIGRINISENTYDLIKDQFHCEYRGEIEVKNQRVLKMYYVNSVKEDINQKAV